MGNPTAKPPREYHFKKGQSGNPSGRPKKYAQAVAMSMITYADYVELVLKCSQMSRPEIKTYLERPEATMFELIYGRQVLQAATGDKAARQELTERLFGKVKEVHENLNLNVDAGPPTYVVEMEENGKFVAQRPTLLKASGDE